MACKKAGQAIVCDLIGFLGLGTKNKASSCESFETVREKNWGPLCGAETPWGTLRSHYILIRGVRAQTGQTDRQTYCTPGPGN